PGPRAFDSGRLLLDVLALGIIRAGDKLAKPAPALHQLRVINRAFLIQRLRRSGELAALGNLADVAALGITRTAIKRSEPSALELHLLATQLTRLDLFFTIRAGLGSFSRGDRFGVARRTTVIALQVLTKAPELLHHAR